MARRRLKIKILGTWGDTAGRLAVVRAEVSGRKIAFLSIYAPNSYDRHFYAMLTDKMLELSEYSFIAGADFNAVWNATVDRSGSSETNDQKSASAATRAWSNSLGLIDLRRGVNPSVRDYTFYSHQHKSSSRIDYIFVSAQPFQNFSGVTFLPMALSDRKGVLCFSAFSSSPSHATRWCFNTTLLENQDFRSQFIDKLGEFLEFNLGSVSDHRILWDSVKGFIRSNATLFAPNQRKARSFRLQKLEADLARIDTALSANFSEHLYTWYELVKKEINLILKQRSEFLIHRTKQSLDFPGM